MKPPLQRITGVVLLVVILMLAVAPMIHMVSAESPMARTDAGDMSGFERVAENDRLVLYLERGDSQLVIEDKRSGRRWYTNPLQEDEKARFSGDFKRHVDGPFLVRWVRAEALTTLVLASALWDGEAETQRTYEMIDDGFRGVYALTTLGISVTVEYRVRDDYLEVTIPEDGVQDTDENMLVSVELLPFLGTAPEDQEEGFLLMPDGSGALLEFGKTTTGVGRSLSKDVYGPHYYEFAKSASEPMTLPIIGISHGHDGFLAVATDGDGETKVNVYPPGSRGPRYSASLEAVYRTRTRLPKIRMKSIQIYQDWRLGGARAVRYYFVTGEDVSYVEMAQRYREHLLADTGPLRAAPPEPRLKLRLFCGVPKQYWFGDRLITTTTFEQAEVIIGELVERGITDIDLTLVGWNRWGYDGAAPKRLPIDRRLGGSKGLQALVTQAHQYGMRVFLDDDYLKAFSEHGGFSARRDSIRQPSGIPNHDPDTDMYLLSPIVALERYAQPDIADFENLGMDGLELRLVGDVLLSDANERYPLTRDKFADTYWQLADLVRDRLGYVAVQGGNGYVLGMADVVLDAPLESSRYNIATAEVPFWPLVAHGLVAYSGAPFNLSSKPAFDLLRQIEYGALPRFELTYDSPEDLERTAYNHLFTSEYVEWLDTVEAHYRIMQEMGAVVALQMTGHACVGENLYRTLYADGTSVFVNYGTAPQTYQGTTVDAQSYAIVKGDSR